MALPYWRLSSFYLCYFAALGSLVPYWSLYLKGQGFDAAEIGQLSALLVGAKVVAPNVWGWIADREGNSLHIIRWTAFYATVLFAWFLTAGNFLEFAVFSLVFSFFWNASLPLYEAVTLAHLRTEAYRYSRIRLWGSIGFILAVLGVGRLLDGRPVQILPYFVITGLALTWLCAWATPGAARTRAGNASRPLGQVLKQPGVLAFLLVYVLIQVAHAPYYVFYSIYLKAHHYPTTITGLFWSMGVVAEVVLFLLVKGVLRRYSLRTILLTSLLGSALRWWLIGQFPDQPWLLAGAQVLHAASFGGVHVAAIHYVHVYFDPNHQSKGQALYHSLSFGLGGMLGSLLSGRYWDEWGSYTIFSLAAACCIVAWLIAYAWVGKTPARGAG